MVFISSQTTLNVILKQISYSVSIDSSLKTFVRFQYVYVPYPIEPNSNIIVFFLENIFVTQFSKIIEIHNMK